MTHENDEMSKQSLQIAYEGPEINGSIDAKDLSYALFALSEIFQEANLLLNKSKFSVSVKVKADFAKGSFEINFEIMQCFLDRLLPFLSLEKTYSALEIAQLIGLVSVSGVIARKGLIQILKFIKGRKHKITESSNGKFKLITETGELEIEGEALKLLNNSKIRSGFLQLLKPLEKPGVSIFEVREDKIIFESIKKEEVEYFQITDEKDIIVSDFTVEKICEIRSLSFEKDLTWKLYDGEQKFNAKLCDERFFESMNSENISFKKGDKFKMKIRTFQSDNSNGTLKTSHEIIQVLEKYTLPEQLNLNI